MTANPFSHTGALQSKLVAQALFHEQVNKAALDNPDLPIDFIQELLVAKAEDKTSITRFVPLSSQT